MAPRPRPRAQPSRFGWYERQAARRTAGGCRTVADSCETAIPALAWLGGEGRDAHGSAERRAEQLIDGNRGLLRDFGVEADVRRRDGIPSVLVRTTTRVGAIPLVSPVSGRPDLGLVVEPRFLWSSLGDVLAATGFRVVPTLLPLPELPHSERRIPPWVLSSVVLRRLAEMLERLARRFVQSAADLSSPRGAIDWETYATQRLPAARATDVPCRFVDLRDDEELRSAISFVLRRQRDSLLGQRGAGVVVAQLLALCDTLLAKVAGAPPRAPREAQLSGWRQRPMSSRVFRDGLAAIEWTVEERGLAGLSELSGLSWRLDMAVFFEAWVETLAAQVARTTGSTLRAGRREETRVNLAWKPPHAGSQRSLLPDVVLERSDVTVVFDAKYKRHAEELELHGWGQLDDVLRERHRADLLQVLAYSTLFETPRVVACLVYPCRPETFASLVERDRVVTRARVVSGSRHVELALAAVPMGTGAEAAEAHLTRLVLQSL
jgi:hypothetical protein